MKGLRISNILLIMFVVWFIYGCSTVPNNVMLSKPENSTTSTPLSGTSTVTKPSINATQKTTESVNPQTTNIAELTKGLKTTIHFNFNSYQIEQKIDKYGINESPIEILNSIVVFMKKHPKIHVRIEGNCDNRGTQEYNLALGQKRADAAKNYLIYNGISSNRISTVSFGENNPVATGNNERAWAKNRRDDFVFYFVNK